MYNGHHIMAHICFLGAIPRNFFSDNFEIPAPSPLACLIFHAAIKYATTTSSVHCEFSSLYRIRRQITLVAVRVMLKSYDIEIFHVTSLVEITVFLDVTVFCWKMGNKFSTLTIQATGFLGFGIYILNYTASHCRRP